MKQSKIIDTFWTYQSSPLLPLHILELLHGEEHHRHFLPVDGEQHLGRGRVLEHKLVARAQLHLKRTREEKSTPNPPEHQPKSSVKSLIDGFGAASEIGLATLLAGLAVFEMAGELDPVQRRLGGSRCGGETAGIEGDWRRWR